MATSLWNIYMMLLYEVVHGLYRLLQRCLWMMTGVQSSLDRRETLGKYDECTVHVQRVLFRYKALGIPGTFTPKDFILSHEEFVSPNSVLRENISLYTINAKEAYFVEVPSDVDILNSDIGCFMREVQYKYAIRLYSMPMSSFHSLAEKVGDPGKPVIVVANTGRCGSSLFTQLMESTGCVQAYSEPECFTKLNSMQMFMQEDKLSSEQILNIATSCMWLLCKNPRPETKAFMIKLTGEPTALPLVLKHSVKDCRLLFMYRDIVDTAQSYSQLLHGLNPFYTIYKNMGFLFSPRARRLYEQAIPSQDTVDGWLHHIARRWRLYLEWVDAGVAIAAVKYEDLITGSEQPVRAVLRYCAVPENYTPLAMRALGQYSQRSSHILKMRKKKVVRGELTCDSAETLRVLDLPEILPRTITQC